MASLKEFEKKRELSKELIERIAGAISMGIKEEFALISWLIAGGVPEKQAEEAVKEYKSKNKI